jgi:hypothetical protein
MNQPSPVQFDGLGTATFSRFATDYLSSGIAPPEWHFRIEDDHTAPPDILVTAQLIDADTLSTVRTFNVPYTMSPGYNRAIAIGTTLAPELGTRAGKYQLSLVATDQKGNASKPTVVRWTQTIRVPPIRARGGSDCDGADSECPYYYSLNGRQNANTPITQTGTRYKVGHLVIDNPNDMPVRVNLSPAVSGTWSETLGHTRSYFTDRNFADTCGQGYETLQRACYSPAPDTQSLGGATPPLYAGYRPLLNGLELPSCAGCALDERQIPAKSTLDVWVYSSAFTFLWQTNYALTHLTPWTDPATYGHVPSAFGAYMEYYYSWNHGDFPNAQPHCDGCVVTLPGELQHVSWIQDVSVSTSITVNLSSRLALDSGSLQPAFGVGVPTANATSVWWTSSN